MKVSDVRAKTADELKDELVEAEERAVQPALPAGDPAAGSRPRGCVQVRRDIARIKTVLGEKSAS